MHLYTAVGKMLLLLGIIIHLSSIFMRKHRGRKDILAKKNINQGLIPTQGFIYFILMASFARCCFLLKLKRAITTVALC